MENIEKRKGRKFLFFHIVGFFLLVIMLCKGFPYQQAAGEESTSGDFEIVDGVLVKYRGLDQDVTIPGGVTVIGDQAFSNCNSLVSVTIPDGVTDIGREAFYSCDNLVDMVIPKGVTSIGDSAFLDTPWLSIQQEKNPLVIINGILVDGRVCEGNVMIPDGVTSIAGYAFYSCSGLVDVTIPGGVTSIGRGAFAGCSGVADLTIPDGVVSIGDGAFSECGLLANVTIPESVMEIGSMAFDETPWLSAQQEKNPLVIINGILVDGRACNGKVVIPDGVTSIGGSAFFGCSNLAGVTIPKSVTEIGDRAFYKCSGLVNMVIPKGVASIGEGAFSGCSNLVSIAIPDSVTSIGGECIFRDTMAFGAAKKESACYCEWNLGRWNNMPWESGGSGRGDGNWGFCVFWL